MEVYKRRVCFAEQNYLNQHSTFELVDVKNDDKNKVIDYANQFPRYDKTKQSGTICPTSIPIPIPDETIQSGTNCPTPIPISVVHKYSQSVKGTDLRYNYRLQFQDRRKVPDRVGYRNYPPCFRKPSQTTNTRTQLPRGNPDFRRHPANRPPSHPANRLPPPLEIHRRHLTNSSTRLVVQDQRSEWKRYLDFVRRTMGCQTEDSDKR